MVATAPAGSPIAMLPAFTAFMISSSLFRSVEPKNWTSSAPFVRFVTSWANQSNATAADSGFGLRWAKTSFFAAVWAKAGARPVARIPAIPVRAAALTMTSRRLVPDTPARSWTFAIADPPNVFAVP